MKFKVLVIEQDDEDKKNKSEEMTNKAIKALDEVNKDYYTKLKFDTNKIKDISFDDIYKIMKKIVDSNYNDETIDDSYNELNKKYAFNIKFDKTIKRLFFLLHILINKIVDKKLDVGNEKLNMLHKIITDKFKGD